MRILIMLIGLLATTPAVGQTASPPGLNLVCQGKASREETPSAGLFGGARVDQRVDSDEAVYLKLRPDNTGEARLPKKIQSKYKQDKDGWFPLVNVKQTPEQVDGQVRLHSMYKPRFHIDRITGQISIDGTLGNFRGQCTPYNAEAPATKF